MFNYLLNSALRAVVSSLRENECPVQYVNDAIGSAVETIGTEAIQRYAIRVRDRGRRFKTSLLGQGFLPGLDDRPEPMNGQTSRLL